MSLLFPALCALAAAPPGGAPRYEAQPLSFPAAMEKLLPADLDGDGLLDLLVVQGGVLEARFQERGRGFPAEGPRDVLRLPGRAVGWTAAVLDRGSPPQVTALVDGVEVKRWPLDRSTRRFLEPETLLRASGVLPRGFHHLPLVQDIDGDGTGDLVIPGPESFQVRLRRSGGGEAAELRLPSRFEVHSRLDPGNSLSAEVGQSVEVPHFGLKDLNGDGRGDLLSETEDRIEAFLAGPQGFPAAPSFTVDLKAVRDTLPRFEREDIDFSNLTAAFSFNVQTVWGDVDLDRAQDLVLRAGGKVSVFLGGSEGIDPRRPHQVLKAAGNVLAANLEDEDRDGRTDLWLWRVEAVSVGEVLLWLVASGKLGFEAFIYRSDGSRFSSRPSRRLQITVRFPSIFKLIKEGEALVRKEKLEELSGPLRRYGDLSGRGERRDFIVLAAGKVSAYLGQAPARPPPGAGSTGGFLEALNTVLGYSREKDEYVLDLSNLQDIVSRIAGSGPPVPTGPPDLELPLPGAPARPAMEVLDLNGDGRDDLLLLFTRSEEALRGAVVLSGPE